MTARTARCLLSREPLSYCVTYMRPPGCQYPWGNQSVGRCQFDFLWRDDSGVVAGCGSGKFDMHVYISEMTSEELEDAIREYGIPLDLHPQLPPPDLTMDKLPSEFIGIYVEKMEQGDLRIPFSTFFLAVIRRFGVHVSQLISIGVHWVIMFEIRCRSLAFNVTVSLFRVFYKLCKQGYWFSFENKVGDRARNCFKEITSSLRGWKKKFFLIDGRAIPKAMPWRHADSDLRDDFPTNYRERDAARLSDVTVPLCPPPRHLLYMCELTTLFITMDDFLSLPEWTGVVVSRGDPITEEQRPKKRVIKPLEVEVPIPRLYPRRKNLEKSDPKVVAAREKSELKILAKAQAKREGGSLEGVDSSSCYPLHSVIPAAAVDTTNVVEKVDVAIANVVDGAPVFIEPQRRVSVTVRAGKKINDLSIETRLGPSSDHVVHSPLDGNARRGEDTMNLSGVHPSGLTDDGDSGADGSEFRFVPDWGLRDDLRICTYRACKELITHLATPAEGEFLQSLSNVDVVRQAYESLDLCNQNEVDHGELDRARNELLNVSHANVDLSKEFSLLSNTHSSCTDRERALLNQLKELKTEKEIWRCTASEQVEKVKSLEASSDAQG
nr:hypothetical protein [Tanacetum cinerariifolium]